MVFGAVSAIMELRTTVFCVLRRVRGAPDAALFIRVTVPPLAVIYYRSDP
jgi:hypothetical protein